MSSMETSNLTRETLNKMFTEDKRFDGRTILDYRPLVIETGISNKAEGSARVRLGKTEVLVGVKMETAEPYTDSPDKGNLMVSCDLLPLASPRFEQGPPKFPAIELPRLVDRALRESGMIDFHKLVITPKERVWTVIVDIYPVNDDGNIVDASAIGAAVALSQVRLPALDKDTGKVDYHQEPTDKKLPLVAGIIPLSMTFYKLGANLILDPTREEEEACDMKITFGASKWNKQFMINSCQKTGELSLSEEEIEKILELLPKKYEELNEKLKKYL